MTSEEIIRLIEENTSARYKHYQPIPMGKSLHFSVTDQEKLKEEMFKSFGRDFDFYSDGDALFFITNGTKLERTILQSIQQPQKKQKVSLMNVWKNL